ncbi:ATP-cone domain protein [Desulfofarcimen acetoxidans DSM 771]|uniref:Transcriptional repressor NrdR n=1 Tax=Desulfofarcimen acetoxidans (strain ATCC 49208 / DSM 771 / KCTC 5769 / VKM B-1644 / 5575) TaxID=485916 RepID=C8W488_DESAS|nr:transcriptional regulator NrdR [Desulfofarcimen acetoxidans]ACV61956.1 ATP-cone domain protein [Desulfofarcimen acetoxidans DSM 771]
MRCPFCAKMDSRVLDSRPADEGNSIRRRRECGVCGKRFTTYEKVDELPLMVVKKDGGREVFSIVKLLSGMLKACHKRPVSTVLLEGIAGEIEKELRNTMDIEIKSENIGRLVMNRLREIDEVAYIRFASVYREFRDVKSFMEEVQSLLQK